MRGVAEVKVSLPQVVPQTTVAVRRVEVTATAHNKPLTSTETQANQTPVTSSEEPEIRNATTESRSASSPVVSSQSTQSRPQARLTLGEKALTVQAQPMPYIPGLTVPENAGPINTDGHSSVPPHMPYLMDPVLLQELHQLRRLHAERASSSGANKTESRSVQSRGTSPIIIPDGEGSQIGDQSSTQKDSIKMTMSTSTCTEPECDRPLAPRRQSTTAAVQTSPSAELLHSSSARRTVEQSIQTSCTECSQIHKAAQELLSIGSRRNSATLDAADLEVQGICAGHALHNSSPKPIYAPGKSNHTSPAFLSKFESERPALNHTPKSVGSGPQRDLSYLEPELCQVSDGLELLSVIAEHAQKQTHSESESENSSHEQSEDSDENESSSIIDPPRIKELKLPSVDDDEPLQMNNPGCIEGYEIPDINKNYNTPKSVLHDKTGFSGKLFGFKKETAGLLAETTFKYPDGRFFFLLNTLIYSPSQL